MKFPIEKIAGGSIGNLVLYVSVIGVLLLIATLLRLKVPFLRRAFIPASLIAGLIGLALGPHILGIIPADMMSSIGALPGHMITIVFACMLLGVSRADGGKELGRDSLVGVLSLYTMSFLQVGLVSLLTALVFVPMMGVDPMFGSVFEIGFAGGHGTAGGMVEVFNQLGWVDGGDVCKTTATIGLLSGIFGGIAIINYGVRKKYTKVLTTPATGAELAPEVYPEGEREPSSYATVSQDVIEPFALHIGVVGLAILIGWTFINLVKATFAINLPLFPFAMIGGWIINSIVQRTSLKDLFCRATFQRIQGVALEILVVGAMASISIPVVLSYWQPLLIGSIVVVGMMVAYLFLISPYIYSSNWFEHGIIRFGAFTGVAAVGYMLLRTADPRMKTNVGPVYALGTPFMSPFVGGGFITTFYPLMIVQMGALGAGAALCAVAVGLILILRIFFWNKNASKIQR